jgi:integrase
MPHLGASMFRREGATFLGDYAREYGLLHAVRPNTLEQYRIVADLFERWAGGPVRLDQLEERSVSEWLRDMAATRAPSTCRSKRVGLLALWRAAAEEGICEPPTRRVRSVAVPARVVEAWDAAEVREILRVCSTLRGRHPCGVSRAAWWDLAVRIAWDTGLRRGDQLALAVESIRHDGTGTIVQSKTGWQVAIRLSPGTLEALRQSVAAAPRKLCTPWFHSSESFCEQFRRVVRIAGVRPGTWKWLRRSSASDVEEQAKGEGAAQIGHAPGSKVAPISYLSPRICGTRKAFPRPL